jgi:hypothetical protein
MHKEVMIKVNAAVDEGIALLVAALSSVDGLITMESCQGEPFQRNAFVVFRLGSWRKCGEFLFDRLLPKLSDDLRSEISLRIEAYDTEYARGWITLPQELVAPLGECIRDLTSTVSSGVLVAGNAHHEQIAQIIAAA